VFENVSDVGLTVTPLGAGELDGVEVGVGLGVGVGLRVGVGLGVGAALRVGVGLGVGVGAALGLLTGTGVGVGVGVAFGVVDAVPPVPLQAEPAASTIATQTLPRGLSTNRNANLQTRSRARAWAVPGLAYRTVRSPPLPWGESLLSRPARYLRAG
jgi:hypothetical protein